MITSFFSGKSEPLGQDTVEGGFRAVSRPYPDSWEYKGYAPDDIDSRLIRAHAHGDVKRKISYFAGFKFKLDDMNVRRMHALQRLGTEIDIYQLPNPDRGPISFARNKALVREALLDDPPDGHRHRDVAHFVFSHSLGGRAFMENMLTARFARNFRQNYAGGVMIAPHVISPYSKNVVLNAVQSSRIRRHPDSSFGELRTDYMLSLWASLKKKTPFVKNRDRILVDQYLPSRKQTITLGQIGQATATGKVLYERLMDEGAPHDAKASPLMMIAGTLDYISDSEAVEAASQVFEADYEELDVYHHPFIQSRRIRSAVMGWMEEKENNWHNRNLADCDPGYPSADPPEA